MGLQYEVATLDDIDEALKPLYAEKDGKFVLAVDGLPTGNSEKLEAKAKIATKEAIERRKQLEAWTAIGKTPDEIQELIAAKEAEDRKKAEEEGDHAKILKQHQDNWEKVKASLESELQATRASERNAIIENNLKTSLVTAGVTAEGLDLLPKILNSRIQFEMDGAKRVIKILSDDGETPLAGNAEDGTATFEDLAQWAVEKYPSLFKGEGRGGGGKQPDTKAGRAGTVKKSDFKTEKEHAAFVDEHGLEAYMALPT